MIDLKLYEKKVFSQYGEDGILEKIFETIGTTNKYFVEFGSDGLENSMGNTSYLRTLGFDGLLMEGHSHRGTNRVYDVKYEFVTAENIENLFEKYNVPLEFDLLSIDIDGNDFYVWDAIKKYKPRVVVIEITGGFPSYTDWVQNYDPNWIWKGDCCFGASYFAMCNLAKSKGYSIVYNVNDVNLIFINNEDYHKHDFKKDIGYVSCRGSDEKALSHPEYDMLLNMNHTKSIDYLKNQSF